MVRTYNPKKKQTLSAGSTTETISSEDLQKMISDTAYFIAEQRGFEGDYQLHDWLEAKARVEHIYGSVDE